MGGLFAGVKHKALPNVYIDLDAARPQTAEEQTVYDEFLAKVGGPAADIIQKFSEYKDAQIVVAAAMTNPSENSKEDAWREVLPNVQQQMEVFTFTETLAAQFIKLIRFVLSKAGVIYGKDIVDVIARLPATAKCIASVFDYILALDEIKLNIPKLVNDLAYFRRNASSYNDNGSMDDLLEKSNRTTMFWAAPNPVLSHVISDLSHDFPRTTEAGNQLVMFFGSVADVCTSIVVGHPNSNEPTMKLCLRCLVGAVLIYDHISDGGAFLTKSDFHVRAGMEFLVKYEPKQVALINAIRFSSKNLRANGSDPKIYSLFQ
jgi:hypothetical protein